VQAHAAGCRDALGEHALVEVVDEAVAATDSVIGQLGQPRGLDPALLPRQILAALLDDQRILVQAAATNAVENSACARAA
jgi:hypothetical protein